MYVIGKYRVVLRMKTGGTSGKKYNVFAFHSVCTVFEFHSKTGGTSGKKNFVFAFHSVCTVFVPFKMEGFSIGADYQRFT